MRFQRPRSLQRRGRRQLRRHRRHARPGRIDRGRCRNPAVVVNGSVGEHLEVLGGVRGFCVSIVPAVDHAHTLDWALRRAVDDLGFRQARSFQYRRRNVDHAGVFFIQTKTSRLDTAKNSTDDSSLSHRHVAPRKRIVSHRNFDGMRMGIGNNLDLLSDPGV